MKRFRYEPMFLTPKQQEDLGRSSVSLGLAPLDEVVDVIRYTVFVSQLKDGMYSSFKRFMVWHDFVSLFEDCWNKDFLMLDADGSLNAVCNHELDDSDAPYDLKEKLGNAVFRWCVDEKTCERLPTVIMDESGKLYSKMPKGGFPVTVLKPDIEAAKMVCKILLGKRPKGCEKYMPKPVVPWLRDSLHKLEDSISEKQDKIRTDFMKKIDELEMQVQTLRDECRKKANELADAEAAKLKEVFQKADEQLGVKGCETIGSLRKLMY